MPRPGPAALSRELRLRWDDWQPLLSIPQGQAWFRPIALLGEDDFSVDQDELTKTRQEMADLDVPDFEIREDHILRITRAPKR